MSFHRPFRFGVINEQMTTRQSWIDHAKCAEALGFATFLIRDHLVPNYFGNQFAPFSALMAAADATTTLRVGTLVIDNDFRHPAVLAKEVATLDLLSDGRFELGLGAGWLQSEYDLAGLPFDPPGVRIDRMEEAIDVLKSLFGDEPVAFSGAHYQVNGLIGWPRPVQRPSPPLLIGGGGKRILGLAGREANIVHFLPRPINTGVLVGDATDRRSAWVAEKIGWVREGAGDRFDQIELGMGVLVAIGANQRTIAEDMIRTQGWQGVDAEDISDMPSVLAGPPDAIVESLIAWRERLGLSYVVTDSADVTAMAPVVARLAGR